MMRARSIACALLLGAAGGMMAPDAAHAVIVEAGTIETNGLVTTADRFYFNVQAGGPIEISIVDLTNPVKIALPSLKVYLDDGTLNAGDLLYSADAPAAGSAAVLNTNIAMGAYLAVVSEFALAAGNFGPLNPNALNPISYDYEIGFSDIASNDTRVTCIAQGNLNGTFTLTERTAGGCASVAQVTEPSALGILVAALGSMLGATQLMRFRSSVQRI
jgi:hypothetical protein